MAEANEISETNELMDPIRWAHLHRAVEERSIETAFSLFLRHGLEPMLFKGWASARNYPSDIQRISTDIDLAFSADEFERAFAVSRGDEFSRLMLDIHREFRHLDTVAWNEVFDRSRLIEISGIPIRIPSPEDHLRLLCVHWLIDGGWFRERLWDIYYAVDRRPDDFDWSKCLELVSPIRRRWVICCIGLAHRYLGLDVDDLPFRDEAIDLPRWLINALEKEWASELRLMPLQNVLGEPSKLFRQIKKRLPPNPISATVDMEGSFDSKFRLHYQVGSIFKRLGPALTRLRRIILR